MLKSISIENIAVIEKAEIAFSEGLNILTGETGAGKSIVIDSINAILGERTTRDVVRHGEKAACVTAFFENINEKAAALLSDMGIESEEDGSLIITRNISADGKSLCRINGRPATVSMLKAVSGELINIHGQHDSQQLLNPASHGVYIDKIADIDEILGEYLDLYNSLRAIKKEINELHMNEDEKAKRTDLLRYQTDEIKSADIKIGEQEELTRKKNNFMNAEKITGGLDDAYNILNGGDDAPGVITMLRSAAERLDICVRLYDKAEKTADLFREAYYSLESCSDDIRAMLSEFDFNAADREETEERLDLIYRLSLKYGKTEKEILEYLEKAEKELSGIEMSDEKICQLREEYDQKLEKAKDLAFRISDERMSAAAKFTDEIKAELTFLDMPRVDFKVNNEQTMLTAKGIDKMEFLISTNPGEIPKPMSKIASGGELSRIMLAIRNVLADRGGVETMIFDEIDTGVSGRAAQKIAQKLKQVSRGRQVICVTHLAQIAAYADNHLKIEKNVEGDRTFTNITSLDFEERKAEISRIIGGVNITELTLKSAAEMLEQAQKSE